MIQTILQWLGVVDEQPAQLDTISAFLQGASIPQISASAGHEIVTRQRQIEAEIRSYIYQLHAEIEALQAQL